jgi:SNF family Na+-dependent transporter
VFFSVAFGKHVLARITWVTVVLPVVLLTILLARVVMLEGAKDGLEFYMGRFDVEVLKDLNMWAAACSQILYSLGQGSGCVITLSSFTKPKHNVFRSCMITALSNSAFSLVGGVAIFSLVGNIAYSINAAGGVLDPATGQMVPTSVAEQAQSGQGLAFIVIANGMQFFGSGANVMSALFFAMLFLLGLDSTYGNVETLVCIAEDLAADWMGLKLKRWMTAAGTCATLFLLGLLYCTRIGNDLLDVTDHYVQGYFILFGIALEAVMFVVDFGWRRLVVHSRLSTLLNAPDAPAGKDLSPFWRFTMCVVVPAVCAVLFASQLAADMREAYQGYPHGLLASGWTLIGVMVATTLFGGAWAWCRWGTSSLVPVEQEEMRLKEALESPGARVRV